MDNNTKVRDWHLSPLRSQRRLSYNSWERGEPESKYQDRYRHGDGRYVDHTRYGGHNHDRDHHSYEGYREYGGYVRERNDEYTYWPRYHDNGHKKENRRERIPKPRKEPRFERVEDHEHHKGYERSMEYKGPNTDTFHMKCKIEAKTCVVIIDGGSSVNMVSERLVSKLSLSIVEHPNAYDLQWLEECGVWRVKTRAMVPLRIGDMESDVLCDVVPMNICHVLLGKPWECDNKAIKNDVTHEYIYMWEMTRVRLKPLLPLDVVKCYEYLKKERERERKGLRVKVSMKSQESVKKDKRVR